MLSDIWRRILTYLAEHALQPAATTWVPLIRQLLAKFQVYIAFLFASSEDHKVHLKPWQLNHS